MKYVLSSYLYIFTFNMVWMTRFQFWIFGLLWVLCQTCQGPFYSLPKTALPTPRPVLHSLVHTLSHMSTCLWTWASGHLSCLFWEGRPGRRPSQALEMDVGPFGQEIQGLWDLERVLKGRDLGSMVTSLLGKDSSLWEEGCRQVKVEWVQHDQYKNKRFVRC